MADYNTALKTIAEMRHTNVTMMNAVDKKRSWRASEKAMAKSTYKQRIDTLDWCKDLLEERRKMMTGELVDNLNKAL